MGREAAERERIGVFVPGRARALGEGGNGGGFDSEGPGSWRKRKSRAGRGGGRPRTEKRRGEECSPDREGNAYVLESS